ncbi:hypothetical protein [Mycobacteroides abscessus]|uniref:Uncharacterized protein n=1 Tax=Mycobacteroides abscessus subsp. bolletii CRM-0020 TaxID=1306401 RepID=A0A829HNW5_9MYCO|nr:hypothetical protein [Mycobacteroides abscessus]EPQ21035.1 hypothetical protein J108_23790 [Mycobacteroides abscessus subsp. bolletii CRM-0020]RIS37915.1 hypothetical protein D2E71_25110 [Mycobacteroides abscessus]RIS77921.1 hypothetical protein D2E54_15320 [Mycobacteroides abscessus]SKQ73278.1 Uncharacterised protein [Mycobacteroides abscessus subsp. massiliense]
MSAYDSYQDIEETGYHTQAAPDALFNDEAFKARARHISGSYFADAPSWAWATAHTDQFDTLAQEHAEQASAAAGPWFSRRYLLAGAEAVVTLWSRAAERVHIWEYRPATADEIAGYLNHVHGH